MKKKKLMWTISQPLDKKQNPKSKSGQETKPKIRTKPKIAKQKFKDPTPLCMYNEHQKN
jgi:hypothetical protein